MSILGNYGKIYIVTKGRGNTCKPSNHKSFVYFYIRQKIVQVHFEIPNINKCFKTSCNFQRNVIKYNSCLCKEERWSSGTEQASVKNVKDLRRSHNERYY